MYVETSVPILFVLFDFFNIYIYNMTAFMKMMQMQFFPRPHTPFAGGLQEG